MYPLKIIKLRLCTIYRRKINSKLLYPQGQWNLSQNLSQNEERWLAGRQSKPWRGLALLSNTTCARNDASLRRALMEKWWSVSCRSLSSGPTAVLHQRARILRVKKTATRRDVRYVFTVHSYSKRREGKAVLWVRNFGFERRYISYVAV